MSESHFFTASQQPDVSGITQTLFDTNVRALIPNTDALDAYRTANAAPELRSNIPPQAQDAEIRRVRYDQAAPPSMEQAAQSSLAQTYSDVRTSWNANSEKKDDSSNFLVYAIEGVAAVVLIRLGLKHLANNGVKIVGEAENLAKGIGEKLNVTPKTFTPSSIAELKPNSAGLVNTHPIPRIRTNERDTGPLRVG